MMIFGTHEHWEKHCFVCDETISGGDTIEMRFTGRYCGADFTTLYRIHVNCFSDIRQTFKAAERWWKLKRLLNE